MRFFPQEAWRRYAGLLIIFFALATLAVWHTLNFISLHLSGPAYTNAAFRVWLITLGFMFITGAFGLWAIQFSAEVESLRRIGRLVDSMDYLSDGLIAIDRRGRVTGSNPAIKSITRSRLGYRKLVNDIFPCLSRADMELLMKSNIPQEIEREFVEGDNTRTLRFRSQPSEGLILILVSDVTSMIVQQTHRRQTAQLQLIGHIAKGVAHDFNNLLCIISGNASLLERLPPDSKDFHKSIQNIIENTERGTSLAGHLLELSRQGVSMQSTNMSQEYVKSAVNLLKGTISPGWQMEESCIEPMPVVPLTGLQIEQVVLNLSILAVDTLSRPGILRISAGPIKDGRGRKEKQYAAAISITAHANKEDSEPASQININEVESGVILSIIKSMLEEAGCLLEHSTGENASFSFHIYLPLGSITTQSDDSSELTTELQAYISGWKILAATSAALDPSLDGRMKEIGITSASADNITSTLVHIEEDTELDAIILDELILSQEVRGLLRAIIKLRPAAAIVVLCESKECSIKELTTDVVFESKSARPDRILLSMIEAKNMAIRRK